MDHEKFMRQALLQAQLAYENDEIPVGAIIVYDQKVIARAYNQTQTLKDPTAHAEMLAITSACNFLGAKYLINCTLYVTLQPCLMCAGAIKWAQLSTIVFGAFDRKTGYLSKTTSDLFPPKVLIVSGVLEKECSDMVLSFFDRLR